jgi:transmembrane sensor
MSHDPKGGPASRTAVEWFTLTRGPHDDDERRAFEEWLSEPQNTQAYESVVATWDQSMFVARTDMGRDRNLDRARSRRGPLMLVAAGIAVLALVPGGLFVLRHNWPGSSAPHESQAIDIAADQAQQRTVRLADGSRLTLDRGASVRDLRSAAERRFVLIRGRARFDVAHDTRRPFVVDAGTGRIIAHGTMFDVSLEDRAIRVVLLRGVVEVRRRYERGLSSDRPRFLRPGEQIIVGADRVAEPSPADAQMLGWPDTMISFDDVPLSRAIEIFNQSSVRKIELAGAGVAGRPLSGAFRRDDPEGFAQAVAASLDLIVDHGARGVIVLRARGSRT